MAKDKLTDYSTTASSNTDVGGVNLAENSMLPSDVNNAFREMLSHLAEMNAGTYPVADTFTLADPDDLTKKFRFDGVGITTGNTRVVTMPDADTTLAGLGITQTFTGDITFSGTSKVQQTKEKMTISATSATGTINYDALTQAVLYYTSDASANWTVNVRGDGSNTLNSIMAIDESLTVVFLVTQGSTAYYNSAFQVDGSSVTPKYQGGSAPSEGTASGIDSYTYTIIKTADATFTVLASLGNFA
jgi:hypothetical protein